MNQKEKEKCSKKTSCIFLFFAVIYPCTVCAHDKDLTGYL